MSRPKTKCILNFDALLHFEAGFYVKKHVSTRRAKKVLICCINTWKSRFSHDENGAENKVHSLCIITFKSRFSHDVRYMFIFYALLLGKRSFSHDAPKMCIFHALLRGKAGFCMTSKKNAYI